MIINGKVAHVGFTNTAGDRQRIIMAMLWMMQQKYQFGKVKPDNIDLRYGRDFLTETIKYDVVFLHFLFRGGFTIDPTGKGNKQLAYSPAASWSAWRKRLVDTGAKFIFAFGGEAEIGGSYLRTLDNYETYIASPEFWIFQKQ